MGAAVAVVEWLLDSDPSIRWQVMRDLTDAGDEAVAAERARVAVEGWGAQLLALQEPDGRWGGGTYFPSWTSTAWTLSLLRNLGLDPRSEPARRAVVPVRENAKWEYDDLPFFDGEVEPCINGLAVALGSYYGQDVRVIVDRLLGDQLSDGGWNCEQERGSTRGSFHSTICVLEGLLEHERATGVTPELTAARLRGQAYLVERRLLHRLSTGEVIDPDWSQFSFPTYYFYDVLRALDYLRDASAVPDERLEEAVALVEKKRTDDGRWLLENRHPGETQLDLDESEGNPSRWNTLRALRVLRWYDQR
ncbi:hypothetical protein EV648_105316 [Kribbella sp. VKM Ac-2568]|nr:hypothetical protein EV648_105316 [Kribbella sp. VKM Ac-2568]